jgi:selenide,water dikinase
MSSLNKAAAEVMMAYNISACTDITGFGLIGHLLEMMKGSQTQAVLSYEDIPFLEEVTEFLTANVFPGGTRENFSFTQSSVCYAEYLSQGKQFMLNDAQTSGGLLIAVSQKNAVGLLKKLHQRGVNSAAIIGNVQNLSGNYIRVE